ncbi:hypothetical protein [Flavobacterium hydrophilum]|uniref:Uncharacterized protein n=1 Tax=Flavobacterium hydrophilum TaxID=2211445 RepID=A0A2V4BX33_9FLAO|nr:hypothetical protein [Flavobacterium hydrophilum]PXY43578.1 hypothetical protein DMB68_18490 [Flavobacterium hydrophilum]
MSNLSNISTALTTTIKDSDIHGVTGDLLEVILDKSFKDGILKDIPIISTIIGFVKAGIKINDALFFKKILHLIAQINDVPAEERGKVISEIDESKNYRVKIGEKLLFIVDKCDDHEKAEIIGYLFKEFLKRKMAYDEFLRCCSIIEKCVINDLLVFLNNDIKRYYTINDGEELLNVGMLTLSLKNIRDNNIYLNISKGGELLRIHLLEYLKNRNLQVRLKNFSEIQKHIDYILTSYRNDDNWNNLLTRTVETSAELCNNYKISDDEFNSIIFSIFKGLATEPKSYNLIYRYESTVTDMVKAINEYIAIIIKKNDLNGNDFDMARWKQFEKYFEENKRQINKL